MAQTAQLGTATDTEREPTREEHIARMEGSIKKMQENGSPPSSYQWIADRVHALKNGAAYTDKDVTAEAMLAGGRGMGRGAVLAGGGVYREKSPELTAESDAQTKNEMSDKIKDRQEGRQWGTPQQAEAEKPTAKPTVPRIVPPKALNDPTPHDLEKKYGTEPADLDKRKKELQGMVNQHSAVIQKWSGEGKTPVAVTKASSARDNAQEELLQLKQHIDHVNGKSKGHAAHIGDHEYYHGPDGDLYRAPKSNPLDVHGYRQGGRFESRKSGAADSLRLAQEAHDKFNTPAHKIGDVVKQSDVLNHIMHTNPPEQVKSGKMTPDEWAKHYMSDEPNGYKLMHIHPKVLYPQNMETMHEDKVQKYAKEDGKNAPPIVLDKNDKLELRHDGQYGKLSHIIVDGKHRAEAARRRGDDQIAAYVPARVAGKLHDLSHERELDEFARKYADEKGYGLTHDTQNGGFQAVAKDGHKIELDKRFLDGVAAKRGIHWKYGENASTSSTPPASYNGDVKKSLVFRV